MPYVRFTLFLYKKKRHVIDALNIVVHQENEKRSKKNAEKSKSNSVLKGNEKAS